MKKRVFIIAEAGVNHNGNVETAKRMVDAAKYAGSDAVKFQFFKANSLVSKYAPKARYQIKTTGSSESHYEMISRLELNYESHLVLKRYCDKKGIIFLSSPFDIKSAELLNEMGMRIFKIPSGEITNIPYLRKIGTFKNRKIIMSTGMANIPEVGKALKILMSGGAKKRDITLLHCTSEYPAPMDDVNLKAMISMRRRFGTDVGYSDHTLGTEVSIAAVALGAKVIEKHFTLNKNMKGPDHKASLAPAELKRMVESIRNIEMALGDGVKRPSRSEIKNIKVVRKSVVTACDILKGDEINEDMLVIKRPGTGIKPEHIRKLIGMRAKRPIAKDELVRWEDVK